MDQCYIRLTLPSICRSVAYILWSSDFASYLERLIWWRNVALGIMDQCHSKIDHVNYMTSISWSIDFALYHCHRQTIFINKKWRLPGVFVPLRALALVIIIIQRNVWHFMIHVKCRLVSSEKISHVCYCFLWLFTDYTSMSVRRGPDAHGGLTRMKPWNKPW